MSGTQPSPQSSIGYSPGSSPPYRAPQSTSLNPYMRPALTQPQFHPAYAQTPYPAYSPQLMWSPGYPNTPQLVPPPNVMRQDNPAAYPNGAGEYYGAYLMTPPKSLHHDNPVAVQPPSVPSSHGQPGGVEPPAAIAGSHENTLPASAPAIHPAATLAPANERGPNSAAPTPETATAISQNAATIAGDSSGSTEDKQDGSDDDSDEDSDDSTPRSRAVVNVASQQATHYMGIYGNPAELAAPPEGVAAGRNACERAKRIPRGFLAARARAESAAHLEGAAAVRNACEQAVLLSFQFAEDYEPDVYVDAWPHLIRESSLQGQRLRAAFKRTYPSWSAARMGCDADFLRNRRRLEGLLAASDAIAIFKLHILRQENS
ncbi:hypothetical protein DFH09DRAFT_1348010 [Mycena vulgaris]|nr:hypothetical protein DFH09DRAFT_1348010 [Mycena vulgaris]